MYYVKIQITKFIIILYLVNIYKDDLRYVNCIQLNYKSLYKIFLVNYEGNDFKV